MSPQELEQWILRPEIDGTLGTLMQKLMQKPNPFDYDKVSMPSSSRAASHHIPILNDMKEYKSWNEKLARKMSSMHKIYKRFIARYDLKGDKAQDDNSKDSGYSSDILKHLINYDDTDCSMRFLHEDMKAFECETLTIVKLFEEMEGRNPFTSKSPVDIQPAENPVNCDNQSSCVDNTDKNFDEGPWDDEEFILWMHEIPIKHRADVILFLWSLKADTDEFSRHIKKIEEEEAKQRTARNKIQKDQKKLNTDKLSENESDNSKAKAEEDDDEGSLLDTEPIFLGKDSKQNEYYYFDKHWDWRVYMISHDTSEFTLVCNSPEELKMLVTSLVTEDEIAEKDARLKEESKLPVIIYFWLI